ncbi:uncharacterized protein L201_007911 [Kwoniella dendrophila CBS 6074]|uniref:Uncharacterized protein n=1 Tax=Kwoniella dendrophila CBS 6074 TaxID=1295534 RepID=A0AAX4K719_9TREE
MAPITPSSLPRLETQPVPPTPLTGENQVISAPANQTRFGGQDQESDAHDGIPRIQTNINSQKSIDDPFRYDRNSASPSPSQLNYQNMTGYASLSPQSPSPRSVLLSPLKTSPTSRPLSPDLPTPDALYLFSNFSSYMRSPNEGSQGLNADDFKDTIRLLEHARWLSSQPNLNVNVLHLKYRFQGQSSTFRSPYQIGDYQLPSNSKEAQTINGAEDNHNTEGGERKGSGGGRIRNPVPQPFSVLHDPVVKIDYMENGVFDPLPSQAIFSHIAKVCQPPPRIIVISYVHSRVIENHLSSLATWAITSSPPTYIFSPIETRLREPQPLHLALGNSVPISMYAWPNELYSNPNSLSSPVPVPFSEYDSNNHDRHSSPSNSLNHLNYSDQRPKFNLNPFSPKQPFTPAPNQIFDFNNNNKPSFSPPPPPSTKHKLKNVKEKGKQSFKGKFNFHRRGSSVSFGGITSEEDDVNSPILLTRRPSIPSVDMQQDLINHKHLGGEQQRRSEKNGDKARNRYSNDPIASLTVISSSSPSTTFEPLLSQNLDKLNLNQRDIGHRKTSSMNSISSLSPLQHPSSSHSAAFPPPVDRIPLWHLAPGVGILHGSTSNSIGIKLSDFSAINLINEQTGKFDSNEAKKEISKDKIENLGIELESIKLKSKTKTKSQSNSHNPSPIDDNISPIKGDNPSGDVNDNQFSLNPLNISRPSSTNPAATQANPVGISKASTTIQHQHIGSSYDCNMKLTHLTPPEPRHNSLTVNKYNVASQSWPAPVSRVPGWRKGRKELMEDTLEELGLGVEQMSEIGLKDDTSLAIDISEITRKAEQLAFDRNENKNGPGYIENADAEVVRDLSDFLIA